MLVAVAGGDAETVSAVEEAVVLAMACMMRLASGWGATEAAPDDGGVVDALVVEFREVG